MIKSEILLYIISIIESYRDRYNMEGKEIVELFKKYNVFEYIIEFYDVLHTQSITYGIDDIHEFILNRGEKR
ncbi:DUF3791 domain-containing protein [Clostridium botulinum]|uniref:DUF3791 domain-containing protein n=1 Tax=Clostridium botulinum TaxID=1491 RepID=UPI000773CED8|nr:DUF3791 domain-containing protein [Clostridium botulinum]NFE93581.1 DUF3791 domain-containing protein [Clostridium botulinum]NFL38142.1 DUF3791 domain-containing protein [Clostridium botulinum]NFL64370.1 DUF3791 domain-containing protein [Clostridium botulinum]NFN07917.1 DUF3791 domain-containing protein [Clostridium botulinum]NFN24178.1 DUF3791 domain-containing protein [Clostridium botulinum]